MTSMYVTSMPMRVRKPDSPSPDGIRACSLGLVQWSASLIRMGALPKECIMGACMNDYRTDILFDLCRAIRTIHPTDTERQKLLHENLGFWLLQVTDVVEQRQWMELFVLEFVKTIPGIHEDYVWAAMRNMLYAAQVKK